MRCRSKARHYWLVAGHGKVENHVRRYGSARSPLCKSVDNLDGYKDSLQNSSGRVARGGSLLALHKVSFCLAHEIGGKRKIMIRVGVIGYGYWGPNIVRNFQKIDSARVEMICDKSPEMLNRVHKAHPEVKVTSDANEVLTSKHIDAVAIVTPVWTHFSLAKAALENGKHVFVEKPFTSDSAQAEELIDLADQRKLTIMVDHTFLFTGAVRKIRQLIDSETLGNLYYYDSTRVNLGLFQHDVNVIWDLAPHDLSIMDYLLGGDAEAISATGQRHLNGHEDIAFITVYF